MADALAAGFFAADALPADFLAVVFLAMWIKINGVPNGEQEGLKQRLPGKVSTAEATGPGECCRDVTGAIYGSPADGAGARAARTAGGLILTDAVDAQGEGCAEGIFNPGLRRAVKRAFRCGL